MITKIAILRRWRGKVPMDRSGVPIPKSLWPRRRTCVYLVRWFAVDAEGKTVRPSKRFPTLDAAEAFRAELQKKFDTQPDTRRVPKPITLREFAEEFCRLRIGPKGTRLRPRSIESARYILKKFADFIGPDRRLTEVRAADAARYFAHLHTTGLAVSSINVHKRTAKAAFATAVQQLGYLAHNPLERIGIDRVTDVPTRYVSHAEFAAIRRACEQTHDPLWWQCFVTICYTAALRVGEAIHLVWSDVDFEKATIRVCAKDGNGGTLPWSPKDSELRVIPVPAEALALLVKLQERAADKHPYLFISPERLKAVAEAWSAGDWGDTQAVLNNVARDFRRIVRLAGKEVASLVTAERKPTASLHDLRRTCITNWTKRVNVQTVMALAGHSSITTTQRYYLSATDDQIRLAREAAGDALQLAGTPSVKPRG